MTPKQIIAQLNRETRKRFKDAAKTIPPEVVAAIQARAKEAVESREAHKATGGWIIKGFEGKHDICGLLEVATVAKNAEERRWHLANPYQF